jgi:hypothetical protein
MGSPLQSWVFAALVLLCLSARPALAGEASDGSHVRTSDSRIRAAIADGLERSTVFRDLVAQIDASDVIVYADSDCLMPERLQGRLTFMSKAGGRRYVMVRISCQLTAMVTVAMLGHELWHALEIAKAASVVDDQSLAEEYRRIGFASRSFERGVGYDSRAAIDTGYRVWQELSHRGE